MFKTDSHFWNIDDKKYCVNIHKETCENNYIKNRIMCFKWQTKLLFENDNMNNKFFNALKKKFNH